MWQPGMTLYSVEKEAIQSAMKYFLGSKTAVAEALGISVKTLYNKLDVYEQESKAMGIADAALASQRAKDLENARSLTNGIHGLQSEVRVSVQPTKQIPEKQAVSVRVTEKV